MEKSVEKSPEKTPEKIPEKISRKTQERIQGKTPQKAAGKGPGPEDQPDGARARILSRYALVESGDYFQVLGVSRDATAGEVQRAHERVAGEVGPEAVDSLLAGELGAQIEAIRAVVGEALRILRDDRLRTRYRSRLGT